MGTSPNLCYIPGPDPPTNSAGGNREEQQDRTSNIIQFELGWNPHGYWLFGSVDFQSGNMISSAARYDHFDTLPYKIVGVIGENVTRFRVSPVMTASIPLHRKRRCTRCPFIIAKRRASVNEKSCEAGIWREKSVWAAWDCAERGSAQKKMCYNNFQEGACAKARKCGASISLQGAGIYITQRKRGPGGWNL